MYRSVQFGAGPAEFESGGRFFRGNREAGKKKNGASVLLLFVAAAPLMWEALAGGPMG